MQAFNLSLLLDKKLGKLATKVPEFQKVSFQHMKYCTRYMRFIHFLCQDSSL